MSDTTLTSLWETVAFCQLLLWLHYASLPQLHAVQVSPVSYHTIPMLNGGLMAVCVCVW